MNTRCWAQAVLALCATSAHASVHDTIFAGHFDIPPDAPANANEAARFLTQATFGPNDADIDRVMAIGYGPWIDEQFAKPASTNRPLWEAADALASLGVAGVRLADGFDASGQALRERDFPAH